MINQKQADGRSVDNMLGVWSLINSIDVVISLIRSAPDFIVFDLEHGNWDYSNLAAACELCAKSEILSIIRVASPSLDAIQSAYDCNPYAIQVSGLNTAEDFDQLSRSTAHRPSGDLGFSPWTSAGFALGATGVIAKPRIIPQIESRQSIEVFMALDIQQINNYFGVFLGRYDLSVDLEQIGKIDSKRIIDILKQLVLFTQKTQLKLATVSNSNDDVKSLLSIGVNWISMGSDRSRISISGILLDK
jgi:2-keto-3-deoxy-L-rhamnonate aldolase RhmA